MIRFPFNRKNLNSCLTLIIHSSSVIRPSHKPVKCVKCVKCVKMHVTHRASSITALRQFRHTEQRNTSHPPAQNVSIHLFLYFCISLTPSTSSYKNHPNNNPNNNQQLPSMLKVFSSSTLAEAVKPANDYTSDQTPHSLSQTSVYLN